MEIFLHPSRHTQEKRLKCRTLINSSPLECLNLTRDLVSKPSTVKVVGTKSVTKEICGGGVRDYCFAVQI
jgi:hypothetical protein